MLRRKCSRGIQDPRAIRLREANFGKVTRSSAFVALNIPSRETASDDILTPQKKHLFFWKVAEADSVFVNASSIVVAKVRWSDKIYLAED